MWTNLWFIYFIYVFIILYFQLKHLTSPTPFTNVYMVTFWLPALSCFCPAFSPCTSPLMETTSIRCNLNLDIPRSNFLFAHCSANTGNNGKVISALSYYAYISVLKVRMWTEHLAHWEEIVFLQFPPDSVLGYEKNIIM